MTGPLRRGGRSSGSSSLYFFDVGSGSLVGTSADEAVGYFLGNTLVEGLTAFEKRGGATGTLGSTTGAASATRQPAAAAAAGRRAPHILARADALH